MTYDPNLWRNPDDIIWALREASKPIGFIPFVESTADFAKSLETDQLLRQSEHAPVWHITDEGRAELTKLEAAALTSAQRTEE